MKTRLKKDITQLHKRDDPYREWKKGQVDSDVNEETNKLLTNHDSSYKI